MIRPRSSRQIHMRCSSMERSTAIVEKRCESSLSSLAYQRSRRSSITSTRRHEAGAEILQDLITPAKSPHPEGPAGSPHYRPRGPSPRKGLLPLSFQRNFLAKHRFRPSSSLRAISELGTVATSDARTVSRPFFRHGLGSAQRKTLPMSCK